MDAAGDYKPDPKKSLFDMAWEATKEAIDAAMKPIIKRDAKRGLKSAYDDACKQEIGKQREYLELTKDADAMKNLSDNTQKLLNIKSDLRKIGRAKQDIKELYLEIFGEDLKVED